MDANRQNKICELAEKEIDSILNKPEMTPTDLSNLGDLVDIIKDMAEVKAMDERDYMQGASGGRPSYYGSGQLYYGYEPDRNRNSYGGNQNRVNRYPGNSYGYDDLRMMNRDWM